MRYGYFDSEITGVDADGMPIFDRAESSDLFRLLLGNLVSNGVLATSGTFFVEAVPGAMQVTVNPGFCMIEGAFGYETAQTTLNITAANGTNDRIDAIVLALDYQNREIALSVKTGTPALEPAVPSMQRDVDKYELYLATILIPAGSTEVRQTNIADRRQNSTYCGLITQLIDHLETGDWAAQFEAWEAVQEDEFTTWFDSMKDQLSSDAAGNLQNEIDDLANQIAGEYYPLTEYEAGDYCMHEGALYRALQYTTGTWTPSHWTYVRVGWDLAKINSGYRYGNPSGVSIPSGTFKCVYTSANTLQPGVYLVAYGAAFAANGTGNRKIGINANSGSYTIDRRDVIQAAISGDVTRLHSMRLYKISTASRLSIWAEQTSGGALNVTPYLDYIQLK